MIHRRMIEFEFKRSDFITINRVPPDYTVTHLDISNMKLTKLPDDIHRYTKLTHLHCNDNYLTFINDDLPYTLEFLSCSKNKLTSLKNLPRKLIHLYCNDNLITSLDLPETLINLVCSHNKLRFLHNLPDTIEFLNCSYNDISWIDNMPNNIKHLNCNNNVFIYDFKPTIENIRNYNEQNRGFLLK